MNITINPPESMHKHTKLLPYQRREIYRRWLQGEKIAHLAAKYEVSRKTIYEVLKKAKSGVFVNYSSMNYRYRDLHFGLRKLSKTEKALAKKIAKREKRLKRYERYSPGELVHFDTKRLPLLPGEAIVQPREHLHVAVDDYSRWLFADIFPDKTSYSSAIHLDETIITMPFQIECTYSDNGSEYKGRKDHPFVQLCTEYKINQKFTMPNHPQSNGKAERVIRTLMTEWYRRGYFDSREKRRRFLYSYVNWYNNVRPHQSLQEKTPLQRLEEYFTRVKNDLKSVTNP